MENLIWVYPAFLLGLAAGVITAWLKWPSLAVALVGAALFAALVFRQTTGSNICPPLAECEGSTAGDWGLLALANVGAWILGLATGTAIAQSVWHAVWKRRRPS